MKDVQRFKNQVQHTLSIFGLDDLIFIVNNTSHSGIIIEVSTIVYYQTVSVRIDASDEKRKFDEFWADSAARAVCENILKQALSVVYSSVGYRLDREWDEYEGRFQW